jgi:hypothetical protein
MPEAAQKQLMRINFDIPGKLRKAAAGFGQDSGW